MQDLSIMGVSKYVVFLIRFIFVLSMFDCLLRKERNSH